MKRNFVLAVITAVAVATGSNAVQPKPEPGPVDGRPRVIATTDGEVDDRSSMIRFLLYSCDFDVSGIVQVNSRYQKSGHSDKKWIEAQLDTYEKLLPNLRKHNPNYPDADQLRSVMRVGNENRSDLYTAPPDMKTKNTAGAQLFIDTLLDDDQMRGQYRPWDFAIAKNVFESEVSGFRRSNCSLLPQGDRSIHSTSSKQGP